MDYLDVLDQLLPECYFQTKEIGLPTDQTLSQIIYRNQTGFGLLCQPLEPARDIFRDLETAKVPFGLLVSLEADPDLPELQVEASPANLGNSLVVILNGLDSKQGLSKLRLVINAMLLYHRENAEQLN